MSLDLLMGYTGPRVVRSRGVLRPRRVRDGGAARARHPVALARVSALRRRGRRRLRVRGGLLRHRSPRDLLRAPHADLRRGGLHRSSATRRRSAGSDGIQGLPAPQILPGVAIDTPIRIYYLGRRATSSSRISRAACWCSSHFGQVLVAIRENEDRARFLGYNVQRYKMGVCVISAVLTGLAGALYPGRAAYATPDLMHWSISGEFIIMVMIGGLGTLVGPDHRRRVLHRCSRRRCRRTSSGTRSSSGWCWS